MNQNLTALMSSFVRYYHTKYSNIKIVKDNISEKLLTKEEINTISSNLKKGINFFNPNYKGDNPIELIVNNNLAPTVLARSAINERYLINELSLGLKQYLILASGYDTSAWKVNKVVKVFELDKKEMIEDKEKRIEKSKIDCTNITYIKTDLSKNWSKDLLKTNYDKRKKTFCSLLGISYYLEKDTFLNLIKELSNIIPIGSTILFDYPNVEETEKEIINQKLAKAANEEMKAKYLYQDIEILAEKSNLIIYEHINDKDVNHNYFYNYNTLNPNNRIMASKGVSYVILGKIR